MPDDLEASGDDVDKAWNDITNEWGILGDQWDLLQDDYIKEEGATLALRENLPKLIGRYKQGMDPNDIAEMNDHLLKMDKHVLYTAQLYLNILEVGFDKHQAFVLLCQTIA